jgi:hypothetical protein
VEAIAMAGVDTSRASTGAKRPLDEVFVAPVREGGVDGITRYEVVTMVIGYWIRRARDGRVTREEAWEEAARIKALDEKKSKLLASSKSQNSEEDLWFGALTAIGKRRGYKSGWAARLFFDKFQHWPSTRNPTLCSPTQEIFSSLPAPMKGSGPRG